MDFPKTNPTSHDKCVKFVIVNMVYSCRLGYRYLKNAWFHLSKFDKGVAKEYNLKSSGNGIYAFILSGDVTINGQELNARDGFGIWEVDQLIVTADSDAEFLLMEVPME